MISNISDLDPPAGDAVAAAAALVPHRNRGGEGRKVRVRLRELREFCCSDCAERRLFFALFRFRNHFGNLSGNSITFRNSHPKSHLKHHRESQWRYSKMGAVSSSSFPALIQLA